MEWMCSHALKPHSCVHLHPGYHRWSAVCHRVEERRLSAQLVHVVDGKTPREKPIKHLLPLGQ